ncbi:MAG: Rrf2 family transcriptional regulator [bacterium]|nr:Rrf2 family transcriptional regulator [bacterium]
MLKLSKKADYALVALSHLQSHAGSASAKEIADFYNLSPQMLANVLKRLAATGMLLSKRGVAGGYALGRHPQQIFLGEVIDVIDGKQALSDCTSFDKDCSAEPNCPVKSPISLIHNKIKHYIDSLTLADIANRDALRSMTIEGPVTTNL